MANFRSPGVKPKVRDLSTIVGSVATSTGALVGYSAKGSLERVLITDRQQFIREFGEPEVTNYFHYTALAFLEKSKRLYCLRVTGDNPLYSGLSAVDETNGTAHRAHSTGQLTTDFYNDSAYSDELFSVFAKDPGAWGDNIAITITDVKGLSRGNVGGDNYPTAEQYTFKVNVWYTDSEGNTTQVESWLVSRKTKVDGYGKQMYLEEVINSYSNYIVVADNTAVADTVLPLESTADTSAYAVSLGGGDNGDAVTAADIVGNATDETGWYAFNNVDDVDVQLLLGGGFLSTMSATDIATIQTAMIAVAENRRDAFAILDIPLASTDTTTEALTYRNDTLNANTSYAALYSPWCKINDPYNDRIVQVPPSGYVGAQFAYNDYNGEVWTAPAGFTRGVLNVLGLTTVYTEGERDILYDANINPLQTFRGGGHVIWGQKTQQLKRSALDRVNVRRLINTMEKEISTTLQTFTFEPNSELIRFQIKALLDEYCDKKAAKGAFQTEGSDMGYLVICDETNNTAAVIDANELHVDVFVKPSRSAEFIQLQTTITSTGVSFEELISRGVLL